MQINAKKLCLFVSMSTAAGLWTPEQVLAQDSNLRTEAVAKAAQSIQPPRDSQQPAPRPTPSLANDPFYSAPRISVARAGSGAIRKAAEAVRDAQGEDAKAAAQKKLTDLLSKSYDEDMAQRERELKQIEERLTKLRELLSRRRSKKQDIIDLQIKVALNDADGLGFYDNEGPPKGNFNPFYYGSVPPVPRPVETLPPTPSVNSSSAAPRVNAPTRTSGGESFVDPAPSSDSEPLTPGPSR